VFSVPLHLKPLIVTEIHALQVYLGDEPIQIFEYRLPPDISS
jgi:hypothetical protein